MSDLYRPAFELAPKVTFSTPESYAHYEELHATSLAKYGHKFENHERLLGAATLASGVLCEEIGPLHRTRDLCVIAHFNNSRADGTFAGGSLLVGADDREIANQVFTPYLTAMNVALGNIGADFRLGDQLNASIIL